MSNPPHSTGAEHHIQVLDAKLWEKGVWADFILCLDITDPMDHCRVITPQAVQCSYCHGPGLCCMQHHTPYTWWIHQTSGQKWQIADLATENTLWVFMSIAWLSQIIWSCALIFYWCKLYNHMKYLNFPEANGTIQKLNTESASGVSAAVGAAEAESRQLREELAILHKVVAGKWLRYHLACWVKISAADILKYFLIFLRK